MIAANVPVKTPEGQAELSHRHLKLGQRQRTLLLLVDGRRSEAEVRRMAAAAGVPDPCFDELCGLGLIALPTAPASPSLPAAAAVPVVPPSVAPADEAPPLPVAIAPAAAIEAAVHAAIEPATAEAVDPEPAETLAILEPIEDADPADPAADLAAAQAQEPDAELQAMVDAPDVEALAVLLDRRSVERVPVADAVAAAIAAVPQIDDTGTDSTADESLLPAAQTLQPDAENSGWQAAVSLMRPSQMTEFDEADPAFEEARDLLVRAVRTAAPVAGSLTMIRLRRARSRADLVGLLGEVEARIVRPPRELAAQQTLRRVRLLLDVPHDSLLPVLGT